MCILSLNLTSFTPLCLALKIAHLLVLLVAINGLSPFWAEMNYAMFLVEIVNCKVHILQVPWTQTCELLICTHQMAAKARMFHIKDVPNNHDCQARECKQISNKWNQEYVHSPTKMEHHPSSTKWPCTRSAMESCISHHARQINLVHLKS